MQPICLWCSVCSRVDDFHRFHCDLFALDGRKIWGDYETSFEVFAELLARGWTASQACKQRHSLLLPRLEMFWNWKFKKQFCVALKCSAALTRKYKLSQPFLLLLYFFGLRSLCNLTHNFRRTPLMWDRNGGESQKYIPNITKQKKLFKTYEMSIHWATIPLNQKKFWYSFQSQTRCVVRLCDLLSNFCGASEQHSTVDNS